MIELLVAGFALIFALGAAVFAIAAAKDARLSAHYCEQNNKRSKLAALEAEVTDLSDSLATIRDSLKKLRSRQGMRDLREKRKNAPETSSIDESTPEGRDLARAELERELTQKGMLNPNIHKIR